MSDEQSLMPCPFCGAIPHVRVSGVTQVLCTECVCGTGFYASDPVGCNNAITAWNTRTPSDHEKLEAACRALDEMWSRDWNPPHVDKAQQEPRLITEECLDIWRNIRAALAPARQVAETLGRGS